MADTEKSTRKEVTTERTEKVPEVEQPAESTRTDSAEVRTETTETRPVQPGE